MTGLLRRAPFLAAGLRRPWSRVVVACLVASVLAVAAPGSATAQAALQPTEARVYAAALDHVFAEMPRDKGILLLDSTAESLTVSLLRESLLARLLAIPGIDSATAFDFMRIQAERRRVRTDSARISTWRPIAFISASELPRDVKNLEPFWETFYARYPTANGYTLVSPVAFSANRKQALVLIDHACHGLCGSGWIVLLSQYGSTWRVIHQKTAWMS